VLAVNKASPTLSTLLSSDSIAVGNTVSDSATLTGSFQAGGSVTYSVFTNNICAAPGKIASIVTVTGGLVPDSRLVTFNSTGSFSFQAVYSGDANNNANISSCEPLTVTSPTGTAVLLTFSGFNLDDFDNGVGQFQVFVNGNSVVDIPAGLNHLTGSGDFAPYTDTWVKFGPFDITSFVVQGQNTIVFRDPTSFDHFGLVRNVTIIQGTTILLQVHGAKIVSPGHSVTYTFSNPPLVLTSFTVSASFPTVGQSVTFTAAFTGGTGPFRCIFRFGDDERAVVAGTSGTCSLTHDFDRASSFNVFVLAIGASTSDRVVGHLSITVTSGPDASGSSLGMETGDDDD
jgi:hypothetical protein